MIAFPTVTTSLMNAGNNSTRNAQQNEGIKLYRVNHSLPKDFQVTTSMSAIYTKRPHRENGTNDHSLTSPWWQRR